MQTEFRGVPELRKARASGFWQKLNRMMLALIFLCLLVGSYLVLAPIYKAKQEAQRELDQLNQKYKTQKIVRDRLEREVSLLKNDPEFVENIARDKMDLMKEGEVIFRIDGGVPQAYPVSPSIITPASPVNPATNPINTNP